MVVTSRNLRVRFLSIPIPPLVPVAVAIAVMISAGALVIAGFIFIREGFAPSSPDAWYPPSLVTNLWIGGGTMVWLGVLVGRVGFRLVRDLTETSRHS